MLQRPTLPGPLRCDHGPRHAPSLCPRTADTAPHQGCRPGSCPARPRGRRPSRHASARPDATDRDDHEPSSCRHTPREHVRPLAMPSDHADDLVLAAHRHVRFVRRMIRRHAQNVTDLGRRVPRPRQPQNPRQPHVPIHHRPISRTTPATHDAAAVTSDAKKRSTSARRNRYWPRSPGRFVAGSNPARAQRCTLARCTPASRATSPAVSSASSGLRSCIRKLSHMNSMCVKDAMRDADREPISRHAACSRHASLGLCRPRPRVCAERVTTPRPQPTRE